MSSQQTDERTQKETELVETVELRERVRVCVCVRVKGK